MSNSLTVLCSALCLLYLITAKPINLSVNLATALQEIIKELDLLTPNYQKNSSCALYVPVFDKKQNSSIAEISCKAVESMKKVNESEKQFLQKLNTSLVYQIPKQMKCSVDKDEEEDLCSALRGLLSFFRNQMRKIRIKH